VIHKKKSDKIKGIDAPMCKLCETRHWSREAHHFAPTRKKKKR